MENSASPETLSTDGQARTVWIVDDDQSIVWVIDTALTRAGFRVQSFSDPRSVLEKLAVEQPDLLISDIRMPGLDGFELIHGIRKIAPDLPIIIMTAFGDLDSAVQAYRVGAYEYLTKPFDIDQLLALVARCLDQQTNVLIEPETKPDIKNRLLGESPRMQEIFRIIGRIADSSMGVLLRGESGTGKELVANAIYQSSNRNHKPLVAINTAAIPAELLESELFGHEKGAFTGAHERHIGRFEQAQGGTLFLDEIGEMPMALQTRLLRVLSEGRFFRVGGRQEISVDVRIIAATNQPLEERVAQNQFRNDLFHRLNVLSVTLPALRDRVADIPLLVEHFLHQGARLNDMKVKTLGPGVMRALQNYHWPGNIRELENLIQQLIVFSAGERIEMMDLPASMVADRTRHSDTDWKSRLEQEVNHRISTGGGNIARDLGAEFEQIVIGVALKHTGGHRQRAAKLLGWGRNTLSRKLKGIS